MGGHCLPVDPFYLTWRAREFDMSTEFIELAGKINQQMPYHCVERIERALNDVAKPVKGSQIVVLGVSYKGGVGDIRESPGAADHRGARRARRRSSATTTRSSRRCPISGSRASRSRAPPRTPTRSCSSPPIPASTTPALVERSSLFIDLRGVTRGVRLDNLVRL